MTDAHNVSEISCICLFKGVGEGNKEKTPDQNASSRKRDAFSVHQEAEEPTKRTCI